MDTHCLDFDLAVETTEDGDLVRVLASPAGEAVAAPAPPVRPKRTRSVTADEGGQGRLFD